MEEVEKEMNIMRVEDISDRKRQNGEVVLVKVKTREDEGELQKIIKGYDGVVWMLDGEESYSYVEGWGGGYRLEKLLDEV